MNAPAALAGSIHRREIVDSLAARQWRLAMRGAGC
jgi:hypothetical protein